MNCHAWFDKQKEAFTKFKKKIKNLGKKREKLIIDSNNCQQKILLKLIIMLQNNQEYIIENSVNSTEKIKLTSMGSTSLAMTTS